MPRRAVSAAASAAAPLAAARTETTATLSAQSRFASE